MKRIAAGLAIAIVALGPGALRAQNVDSTFAVRSGASFELTDVSGSVHIRAWNRPQIRGEFGKCAERLPIRRAFRLHLGSSIQAIFCQPCPQLFGRNRPISLSVGSYKLVHTHAFLWYQGAFPAVALPGQAPLPSSPNG